MLCFQQSVDEASTVFSYKRAVTDGDEVYEEEYKIDLGRQTEEIRVPAHGRSDAAVVLMDFKEVRCIVLDIDY